MIRRNFFNEIAHPFSGQLSVNADDGSQLVLTATNTSALAA